MWRQKFNLTYWSSDFHGENADCRRERDGWEASSFPLIDNARASWKIWKREREEVEGEETSRASIQPRQILLPSPSNRILHRLHRGDELGLAEHMVRKEINKWRDEPIVNVHHLLAVRTYASSVAVVRTAPRAQTRQLLSGRWWWDGGREGEAGGRGGGLALKNKKHKLLYFSFLTFSFGGERLWKCSLIGIS